MIKVEIKLDEVRGKLDRLARMVGKDMRGTANKALSIRLHKFVMENFETEGKLHNPAGWLPLAPATIAKRAANIEGKEKRAYIRRLYRKGKSRYEVMALSRRAYPGPKDTYLGRFPILQDTGQLRESFGFFSDDNIAGVGAKAYVDKKRKGKRKAPTDIAKVHEEGGGHVPPRPMLPTREQALALGVRVYEFYVGQGVEEFNR